MKLIFIGPPGVGKGTYASSISKIYGIPHISTGDMIRDEIKRKTELGLKIKKYVDSGELVPDEIVIEMVRKRLNEDDCKRGFILDGFPRTLNQAKALDKITYIDLVLKFEAPVKTIIERISGRRICRKCGAIYHIKYMPPKVDGICDRCGGPLIHRKDDTREVVLHRLEVYKKQFAPIIEYYRKKNLIIEIYAGDPAEIVIPRIVKILGEKGFKPPPKV